LAFDAPDAAVKLRDIELALEFAAAEGGVTLRIDRLVEFERRSRIRRTDAGDVLTAVAGQAPIDKTVEQRVEGGGFEPQRSGCPPQPDLDGFGGLNAEIGIADVEGNGRIVSAARKQFGRLGRAFDILAGMLAMRSWRFGSG
jgi:hypothetical protein